jgi:hypothetical protein
MKSDWSVHFIGPDGQTRIGPWLLHDSQAEVMKILEWCGITPEELEDHHCAIRRWGSNSAVVWLTDVKLAALIKRGEGWPWNGYELIQMKKAGKYPPERLTLTNLRKGAVNSNR